MTIARFLKIWEVVRHFKSVFSTSLWMLIPGLNLIVAIHYAVNRLGNLPNSLMAHMYNRFVASRDDEALNDTREYWTQWMSESSLSFLYAAMAFIVNNFAISYLYDKFPEYSARIDFNAPDWVTYFCTGTYIIITAIIVHCIFSMLHQIYKAYTTMHPEYVKGEFRFDYRTARERATEAREKEAATKAKAQNVVSQSYNPA